jgi:hypothetical protein
VSIKIGVTVRGRNIVKGKVGPHETRRSFRCGYTPHFSQRRKKYPSVVTGTGFFDNKKTGARHRLRPLKYDDAPAVPLSVFGILIDDPLRRASVFRGNDHTRPRGDRDGAYAVPGGMYDAVGVLRKKTPRAGEKSRHKNKRQKQKSFFIHLYTPVKSGGIAARVLSNIGLVQEPGWFFHKPHRFGVFFAKIRQIRHFLAEVVQ